MNENRRSTKSQTNFRTNIAEYFRYDYLLSDDENLRIVSVSGYGGTFKLSFQIIAWIEMLKNIRDCIWKTIQNDQKYQYFDFNWILGWLSVNCLVWNKMLQSFWSVSWFFSTLSPNFKSVHEEVKVKYQLLARVPNIG